MFQTIIYHILWFRARKCLLKVVEVGWKIVATSGALHGWQTLIFMIYSTLQLHWSPHKCFLSKPVGVLVLNVVLRGFLKIWHVDWSKTFFFHRLRSSFWTIFSKMVEKLLGLFTLSWFKLFWLFFFSCLKLFVVSSFIPGSVPNTL